MKKWTENTKTVIILSKNYLQTNILKIQCNKHYVREDYNKSIING